MSKTEKIRELMRLAYAGGVYHRGVIQRGRKYVYLLDSQGQIERCNVHLYDAGCPVWEIWATNTVIICALSGRDIAKDCFKTVTYGGSVSPWDVYTDKYGASFISNI